MTTATKLPRPSVENLRKLRAILDEAQAKRHHDWWRGTLADQLQIAQDCIDAGSWRAALASAHKAEKTETLYAKKENPAERYHSLLKNLHKEAEQALPKEVVVNSFGHRLAVTPAASFDPALESNAMTTSPTEELCLEHKTLRSECAGWAHYGEPLHYHSCPKCYEDKPCEMHCTTEPDLYDKETGRRFGSHCICDDCKVEEQCDDGKRTEMASLPADEEPPPKLSKQQASVLFWEAVFSRQKETIQEAARVCIQVGVGAEITKLLREHLGRTEDFRLKEVRTWALEIFEGRSV